MSASPIPSEPVPAENPVQTPVEALRATGHPALLRLADALRETSDGAVNYSRMYHRHSRS